MNTLTKNAAWILLSFVIIGAALSISKAEAETKVYLGAWSTHLVTDGDFNESHDLLAVEHNGWIAGGSSTPTAENHGLWERPGTGAATTSVMA